MHVCRFRHTCSIFEADRTDCIKSICQITDKLQPTVLDIIDDSHLHASHAAMRAEGNKHKETHFRVTVVSDSFHGKPIVARHRMIYDLLSDEFKVGGLHALSLNTKTPSEFKPPSE
ncbi:hypothetical protein SeLEV6574_g02702 [Synchytrium endobioticum]|uniref:BolA protein n=1 Tax=Synchytrium endobioticum TaxID=286115 RepID=A0A507D741_9FUNG|nr:hypothetical protein SeLEV6574_g02702 [Synchytrium endobioticum]